MTERERLNGITESIIGGAIQVHRALGPGLLESAYEACMAFELGKRQLRFEQQKPLPLIYDRSNWTADTELTLSWKDQ